MRRPLFAVVALLALPQPAFAQSGPEGCAYAASRTVNGRVPVYMGTIERAYRICTSGAPTAASKRLDIYADGTAVAALPTHKGGGKGLCVDVGGKRIEVGFDQDDHPFVYCAVSALPQ